MELCTGIQRVVGSAENDEKLRNGVQSPVGNNETLESSADDPWSSVGWTAEAVCIVESSPARDMTGLRSVVMDKVEAREVGHIVVSADVGWDIGMRGQGQYGAQLIEARCTAVGYDELVYTVAHAHHASTPAPAGGVGRGSG